MHHQVYAGTVVAPKIAPPLKKESEKTKSVKTELKKLYPIFLAKHPKCQLKMEGCTIKSTCIHHTEGRGVNEVKNEKTWKASCTSCNRVVEEKHAEAEKKGLKVSRHKIPQKKK
jgi:hypothetical protein